MGRSIAIFTFFALATLAIILFQPGPRDSLGSEPLGPVGTSRNDTSLLAPSANAPLLAEPHPAQSTANHATSSVGPSVETLQAALKMTFENDDADRSFVSPASFRRPDPTRGIVVPQPAHSTLDTAAQRTPSQFARQVSVAAPGDVRSMSWQTLNSLQKLGRSDAGASEAGLLVNSIVKRSMAYVERGAVTASANVGAPDGGDALAQPVALSSEPAPLRPYLTQRAPTASRSFMETAGLSASSSATSRARLQSYTVVSGDSLALIAVKLFGSALAQDQLLMENPQLQSNPHTLRIGQTLLYRAQ